MFSLRHHRRTSHVGFQPTPTLSHLKSKSHYLILLIRISYTSVHFVLFGIPFTYYFQMLSKSLEDGLFYNQGNQEAKRLNNLPPIAKEKARGRITVATLLAVFFTTLQDLYLLNDKCPTSDSPTAYLAGKISQQQILYDLYLQYQIKVKCITLNNNPLEVIS